jgi:hypothetical protein
MAENPYAAPQTRVEDQASSVEGTLLENPRSVPAGNGWSWIARGFELFRQQPGAWVLITIVFVVLTILLQLVPLLGALVVYLLMPVIVAGLMLGCRTLDGGGEISVGTLFSGFSGNVGRLVGLGALGLVAFIVIMFVVGLFLGVGMSAMMGMGGERPGPEMASGILLAVLVMLALSIPVYMALWFAPALVALDDQPIGKALSASFFACLKNIVPFLLYGVIMFVFLVLATIPLGLGLLVMIPVAFGSVYAGYRDLFFEG